MQRLQPNQLPINAVLVDVRDELEAMANPLESIAGGRSVVNIPLTDLEDGVIVNVPLDRPLIVVCGNGSRGELAGAFLQATGVQVDILDGGVRAWKRALEGEVVLEFQVKWGGNPLDGNPLESNPLDGMRAALELQSKLEALPNVRQAGVSASGVAVVRGAITLEQVRQALPEFEVL
jgi:rhodanese-related sulfurtransferase